MMRTWDSFEVGISVPVVTRMKFFDIAIGLGPPNESRLSCGAGLEHSQGEFYHTARKTFSGSLGTGAASFKRWLGCAQ